MILQTKWFPIVHTMESEICSQKIKAFVNYDLTPTRFPIILSSFVLLISRTLIPDNHSESMLSCCHALFNAVPITCMHIQTLLIFQTATQWRDRLSGELRRRHQGPFHGKQEDQSIASLSTSCSITRYSALSDTLSKVLFL